LDYTIGIKKSDELTRGIHNIIQNTNIEGRYEIFHKAPTIIFDAAHNPEGLDAFLNVFKEESSNYNSREIIFASMRDKNINKMLSKLKDSFDKIMVCDVDYERAAKKEKIYQEAKKININVNILANPSDYILDFMENSGNNCLVVLGSIYLLGQIKLEISNKRT